MCVCVDGIELNVYTTMACRRVSSFRATHKQVHTRILKPFEDSEQTGLKVDIPPPPRASVSFSPSHEANPS